MGTVETLFIACFPLAVFIYLSWYLHRNLQIRILELWVIWVCSTLPIGIAASLARRAGSYPRDDANILVAACFPAICIFAGSVWGMSAIRRLGEERTWPRLGILAAGWVLAPALVYLAVFCALCFGGAIDLVFTHPSIQKLTNAILWFLLWFPPVLLVLPGYLIERKCGGKRGTVQKRSQP